MNHVAVNDGDGAARARLRPEPIKHVRFHVDLVVLDGLASVRFYQFVHGEDKVLYS